MIDWDRIAELREDIGPEDFDEVVQIFLDEVEETLPELLQKPDSAEHQESVLHLLKGCAWNLGFRDMGQICDTYETSAANGRLDAVLPGEIERIYRSSKEHFLAHLATAV